MPSDLLTTAPHVIAEDGIVRIKSSCGTTFDLTSEVAMRMSEHLVISAAKARGQARMAGAHLFDDWRDADTSRARRRSI